MNNTEIALKKIAEAAREADRLDPICAEMLRRLTVDRPWWSHLIPFELYRSIVLRDT